MEKLAPHHFQVLWLFINPIFIIFSTLKTLRRTIGVSIFVACLSSLSTSRATENASVSGLDFEAAIEELFRSKGFCIIGSQSWQEDDLYRFKNLRMVIRNAPYVSIYHHRARIEFLIIAGERQILVETKRQNVPGSVDEKLPYVYLNALANIPEREFALVLDGTGWKQDAVKWVRARAAETDGFDVFTPDTFSAWISQNFDTPYVATSDAECSS